MLTVGIVGAGFMGATHPQAWAATPARPAGVVARTAPEAARPAAQYAARVFPSLAALLAEVDVVDICTPTHLHHAMALAAARAGRHVICEKPLARTVEQGREMLAACRAAGVQLLVAHVVRFFHE